MEEIRVDMRNRDAYDLEIYEGSFPVLFLEIFAKTY